MAFFLMDLLIEDAHGYRKYIIVILIYIVDNYIIII